MRITEDNVEVVDGDLVWEIVYRFYNWEVSLPEPEERETRLIPTTAKIWKHKSNCLRQCAILNARREVAQRKMPPLKIKGAIQILTRD